MQIKNYTTFVSVNTGYTTFQELLQTYNWQSDQEKTKLIGVVNGQRK
jgi:hypothetical protein